MTLLLALILIACLATVAWEHRPAMERPKTWTWLDDGPGEGPDDDRTPSRAKDR